MIQKINLQNKFDLFNDHWSPKIVGELNDSYIKLAKFHKEFAWHKHENEDELFLVVKGTLLNQFFDFARGMNPGLAQGGELRFSPLVIPHYFVTRQAAWNKFKLRDQEITLTPGEFIVIPKGIEHLPIAIDEVQVVLLEPKSVLNTGDKITSLTKKKLEYI